MATERDQERNWMEKLKHTYRLVIMNNETFEEIGSYRLSLLNVYIALSTIVVVVAIGVVSLIAFTPLRKYIPGYADVSQNQELYELLQKTEALEKDMNAHRNYAENVRRVLVGDVETEEDVTKANLDSSEQQMEITEVFPSEIDEQLRREVEIQEVGAIAKSGRTTNLAVSGVPLEQMFFTAPVNGEISAEYMPDKKHYGVDILAPKNTAIKAVMDGYVFLSDWTLETGNTVGIQHTNNVISFYKHNSVLLKKAGSYVRAGEAVAIIGNTGTLSDGPHLHFELWYRGNSVDPTEYINF
jgi:murein DD-endopeptidase MepM/ murein hydrolase activator NlpD